MSDWSCVHITEEWDGRLSPDEYTMVITTYDGETFAPHDGRRYQAAVPLPLPAGLHVYATGNIGLVCCKCDRVTKQAYMEDNKKFRCGECAP